MDKDVVKEEKSDATRTQKVLKSRISISKTLIIREFRAKDTFASSRQKSDK